MIFVCKPSKVAIYINSGRKSTAQIKAETGCSALINGGLFNMSSFKPVCHLKVDGLLLSQDQYKYWGLGWNTGEVDLQLVQDYQHLDNYICCVCLVRNGKADELFYNADLGGYRPRTAIGVFDDGRVWMYADASKGLTPEQLQRVALQAGVKHAIMLDGGGSTQGASPTETVNASRRVHNYICVWADSASEIPTEAGGENMFKIALGAGHGLRTPGKRCLKALDPNETREWWLNDRICDHVESYLKDYTGYDLLRLDDSDDGADDVALASRVNAANGWGADIYISVHHNAGVNGGSGGGIVAFSYTKSSQASVEWRDDLYNALIAKTGLKGNRHTPKATANFYVLKYTKMPAVLLELGFMDSKTDVPVILTDSFAKNCAKAIVEVLVKRGKLTKKPAAPKTDTVYRVQVGAFAVKENAERLKADLISKGYPAYIVKA
jgi:N-acetylmuramoyl-L-alanine amidase